MVLKKNKKNAKKVKKGVDNFKRIWYIPIHRNETGLKCWGRIGQKKSCWSRELNKGKEIDARAAVCGKRNDKRVSCAWNYEDGSVRNDIGKVFVGFLLRKKSLFIR